MTDRNLDGDGGTALPGPPHQAYKSAMIKQHMARRVELIVVAVLLVIALAHLLRLLTGAEIVVAGTVLPLWTSLLGSIGPALLAGLFWWSRH